MRNVFFLFTFFCWMGLVQAATIQGKVLSEDEQPIPGALIIVESLPIQTVSDENGSFVLKNISPGTYKLWAIKERYGAGNVSVTVSVPDTVVNIRIRLKKGKEHLERGKYVHKSLKSPSKSARGRDKTSLKNLEDVMEAEAGKAMEHGEAEITFGKAELAEASQKQSGLRAGYADDNKQFNYYLNFLKKYAHRAHPIPLAVEERIWLKVVDANEKPVNNARVQILQNGKVLEIGKTYADGSFFVYPLIDAMQGDEFEVKIEINGLQQTKTLKRSGPRIVYIKLNQPRVAYQKIPLDLLFILDTTGSMGEEIERLKNTIEIINQNLIRLSPQPDIRFGLVLYRDKGDEYVTRFVPFSRSLEYFQQVLDQVEADGGGDTPEDLISALQVALQQLDWRDDAIRLAYIITDAPPHFDYERPLSAVDLCKMAKSKGIKFYAVGTGGLDLFGEYFLRQIAQFTYGRYIFLTYGEQGESEGGHPGSVSHHTGANFKTDKLEAIIIRFTKQELLYQSDRPIEEPQPYFEAVKIDEETREATLNKLFTQALQELVDYSTMPIAPKTKLAILPIVSKNKDWAASAEYFTEQLILAAQKDKQFELVERKDLQKIAEELKLQLSGLVNEQDAAKVGELVGADLVIIGNLFKTATHYELFLKLERVTTSEILSVTKAKIDVRLGL